MTPTDPDQTVCGMDIHFIDDAIMKSDKLGPAKPPILLYTLAKSGGFELVAAEYSRPDADHNHEDG